MPSVFLCHNSKDKPFVRKLAKRCASDGVQVWFDEAELNIGDSLIEKISGGIKNMEYVAVIISKNSIESCWVQKEISLAMSKEIAGRRVTVLPILVNKCSLPEALADKVYADFTLRENYEDEYSKLLRAMGVVSASKAESQNRTRSKQKIGISNDIKPNQTADIHIVDVDKNRTRQDREFPGLHHFFLQLSVQPPKRWIELFGRAREFPRHTMWREAWIERDCIVVKCAVDELEEYHVKDLKDDVATANEGYLKAIEDEERKKHIEREREKKVKQERDKVLNKLEFD